MTPEGSLHLQKPVKLVVQHRFFYGTHRYAPVNKAALTMAEFCDMKRDSFTLKQLDMMRDMGFAIKIIPIDDGFTEDAT